MLVAGKSKLAIILFQFNLSQEGVRSYKSEYDEETNFTARKEVDADISLAAEAGKEISGIEVVALFLQLLAHLADHILVRGPGKPGHLSARG